MSWQASRTRTTFYTHYRNVDDVLREVEDGLLADEREVVRDVVLEAWKPRL
ncbi:MAG: hypothetical protein Q4B54_11990 [Coriobacteriales bacterium]|nr:hypothetical protein [Coriobacteriales bacterium]